ncbi:MAG: hypothetical protein COA58_02855 [Bacteroidetes bacterium]|nr:MAG: hypothetical protein COA58_02855 [Bacteroidota bacterium]
MNAALRNTLNEFEKIPDDDWEFFQSILTTSTIKKGDFLLREGQICKGVYFVILGSARAYLSIDGREVNTSFYFEESFISDFESLTNDLPSKKSIQVMENTNVIFIPKIKLLALYEESTSFQTLGRKILEQVVILEQQYSSLFTIFLPKERYEHVLENHPNLIQRVPLQFLASYLGVARETLSRIRKRVT